MFLLGLLSIVQIAFLPGYLVLRALRLDVGRGNEQGHPASSIKAPFGTQREGADSRFRTVSETLVLSFALSLVANHFLVWILVALGIYLPWVLYALFAAEVALLAWTVRRSGVPRLASLPALRDRLAAAAAPRAERLQFLVSCAACALMAGFAIHGITHGGQIFREWDAVVSWNRWAIDWAAGRLPLYTAEYPQLLPANFSITYVFIQDSSVWFFAKGFLFLFGLLLLAGMFDLGRRSGNHGYVLGVVMTYALLLAILRFRYLSSGYAEVPVAFFAFTSIYALLAARQAVSTSQRLKYVLVGAVCVAGAALTKQAGLYPAALYPLLCAILTAKRRPRRDRRQSPQISQGLAPPKTWPAVVLAAATIVLLVAPWYGYKQAAIRRGADASNVAYLVRDIHEGRTPAERLAHGGNLLSRALTVPGALAVLVLLAFAARDPVGRWLVALFVVPFVLIWAVGFSYDLRNVALAIPFAGAAAGMGAAEIARLARGRLHGRDKAAAEPVQQVVAQDEWRRPPRVSAAVPGRALAVKLAVAAVLLAVPLAWLNARWNSAALRARQGELQRALGAADVNQRLYAETALGAAGPIATDYHYLCWLPGMEARYHGCNPASLPSVRGVYEQPEVKLALFSKVALSPEVRRYLEEAGPGASRLVAEFQSFYLYEKVETSAQRGQVRGPGPHLPADQPVAARGRSSF